MKSLFKAFVLLALSLNMVSCLPKPPEGRFQAIELEPGVTLYKTQSKNKSWALYISADSHTQDSLVGFSEVTQKYYKKNIRLETLGWWVHAPPMLKNYSHIIVISPEKVKYRIVREYVLKAEVESKNFDVFFLTHGFHNHLSTGKNYFLSGQVLRDEFPRLKNLNLVYLQSCFGATLVDEFLNLGARSVVAFEGLNQNVFFLERFLHFYAYGDRSVSGTSAHYINASNSFQWWMENHFLYTQVLKVFGIGLNQYLQATGIPILIQTRE